MNSSREYALRRREASLRRKYNLTLEDYERILGSQDNRCAVCRRHRGEFRTNLCVDHDHKTGEIRGILCTYCNKFIIGRHTKADLLERGAAYLKGPYTGIFANKIKRKRKKKNNNKRKRRS